MTDNGKIIEIVNLKKYFSGVKAVDDISFTVDKGSLFAFLGLNGAGKSTTINMLCSTLIKDSGKIYVEGLDLDTATDEIKRKIGIVFQNSVLDERLSVKDNLSIRASYYALRGKELKNKLNELKKLFDLDEIYNRPLNKLSGGQKRRVDIARALLHSPEILILDEPTTGLDPKTRQMVWEIINQLREATNMTVFLTTHYMEEANKADKVVIIDGGKIVADDTPNNLKNVYSGDYLKLYCPQEENIDDRLSCFGERVKYVGECYIIRMNDIGEGKNFIINNADLVQDFEVIKGDMDDVFLNVTGKALEGGK